MATYLVTGGAGFIGSHLVAELLQRGHRVSVVDDLSTGSRANLPDSAHNVRFVEGRPKSAHNVRFVEGRPESAREARLVEGGPALTFVQGDLADRALCRSVVRGVDYVLHQAAIPSVPRSIEDPVGSHRANVDATLNLLIASREEGVKRVVFAGSSSVYGDAATLPKREDMPPRPLSPYALQKLMSEEYCRLFTDLYRLETVTIRYFNVFGPRQNPGSPYSGVISLFADALMTGRRPIVYGDGQQTRDFTYVANVVDGVLRAAEAPAAAGHVVNVATGSRVSLNTLLSTMNRLLGTSLAPEYREPRAGDIRDSEADISKARSLLGYEPTVLLDEGLRKTLDWFEKERRSSAGS